MKIFFGRELLSFKTRNLCLYKSSFYWLVVDFVVVCLQFNLGVFFFFDYIEVRAHWLNFRLFSFPFFRYQ